MYGDKRVKMNDEIKLKKLEIELEKIKIEKNEKLHGYKMEALNVRKEIAKLYRPKKKVKK